MRALDIRKRNVLCLRDVTIGVQLWTARIEPQHFRHFSRTKWACWRVGELNKFTRTLVDEVAIARAARAADRACAHEEGERGGGHTVEWTVVHEHSLLRVRANGLPKGGIPSALGGRYWSVAYSRVRVVPINDALLTFDCHDSIP